LKPNPSAALPCRSNTVLAAACRVEQTQKPPSLPRRSLLAGILSGFVPAGWLSGCGGGTEPGRSAALASTRSKTLAVSAHYASANAEPLFTALECKVYDVEFVADRFDEGSLCQRFDGRASVAIAEGVRNFVTQDFALSFWARCNSIAAMPLLALETAGGESTLRLSLDPTHGLALSCDGALAPLIHGGQPGEFSDGRWHHILVQRDADAFQLFIDGTLRSTAVSAVDLSASSVLRIGAPPWQGDLDEVRIHDRSFSAREVPGLVYAWRPLRPSNRADSILAYYPLFGDARNATGAGLDGVVQGAVPARNRFGDDGAAMAFNGADAFIEVEGSFGDAGSEYAVAFWALSTSSRSMVALSYTAAAGAVEFVFNAEAALSVIVHSQAGIRLSWGLPGTLCDGQWHFVLAQMLGSSLQIFVDGQLRASAPHNGASLQPRSGVRFARGVGHTPAPTGYWEGSLDDIQIYSRTFAPQDVVDLQGMQFRPRDGAGALTFQDRLWLLGGWNSEDSPTTNSEVWSSADGLNWSLATIAPWEGRHMAGYLVFDQRMWVIGGDRNRGHYQNEVWSSRDGVRWEQATDSPPWADRATHYTAVFKGRMWLLGGQRIFADPGQELVYSDVYSSDDGVRWTLESAAAGWSPRGLILGSAVHRGRLWVIGGGSYDVRAFCNDVWATSDGVHWERVLEQAPWAPRQFHNVAAFDDKLWVIAGGTQDDQGASNDVWYSLDGIRWTQLEDPPWPARHAASVFVRGPKLWLAAGSSTRLYNDVWELSYAR
jgi:hypothetical protein